MEVPMKNRLTRRLLAYPLVRIFIFERRFRIAFILLTAALLGVASMLPAVWRVSPEGFLPVIRVSGLDLLQARALKGSAARAMSAKQWDDAHYCWAAAWSHNPADAAALRGVVESWIQVGRRGVTCDPAALHVLNLLRLAQTNHSDLLLALRVFEQSGHSQVALRLIQQSNCLRSEALARVALRTLLYHGRPEEFEQKWRDLPSGFQRDAELRLYHAAHTAVHATAPDARRLALEILQDAVRQPEWQALASRLQLKVSAAFQDIQAQREALDRLALCESDTLADHLSYWELLSENSRCGDAVRLIQNSALAPARLGEMISMAGVLFRCGEEDRAFEFVGRCADTFGQTSGFWVFYGNELLRAQRWELLRRVSITMRNRSLHQQLAAFSFYLEGRAELGLRRPAAASAAFAKISQWSFPSAQLALQVGAALLDLGYSTHAVPILEPLENEFQSHAEFWMLLFAAADQAKNSELMLAAGRRAHELRPEHPLAVSNYAAALLINRSRPEEAMSLALLAKLWQPRSTAAAINYGAALLQNHRLAEAQELFLSIDTNDLSDAERAVYLLDMFELQIGLGRLDVAGEIASSIETDWLYPCQRAWLNRMREQLLARRTAAAAPPRQAEP